METKCKKSILGKHLWKTTYTISGAGKTFTYPLIPNVCERCGEKKVETS